MKRFRTIIAATGFAAVAFAGLGAQAQSRVPDRLADSTFWRMVNQFSEPNGFFLSENFVSNETAWQTIIPSGLQLVPPGFAYLGVGPEQNFTYIAAFRPRIAFITDIRRQNLIQHLMYKALFELSADRADFMSRLFARARPSGLDSTSDGAALANAFASVKPDSALYTANLAAIFAQLVDKHRFELSRVDSATIRAVYGVFFTMGLEINYSSRSDSRPGVQTRTVTVMQPGDTAPRIVNYIGSLGTGYATFASLLIEDDGAGVNRGWLATEANYRWLRDFQQRNLIVPVVGDFAGPKALRSVGEYLRQHNTRVGAFYASNVEQYLFQGGVEGAFYANVETLPHDSTSLFVRSFPNAFRSLLPPRRQGPRLTQTLTPIGHILAAYKAGEIRSYSDLGNFARP